MTDPFDVPRIPVLQPDEMNDAQRTLHARVVAGPRGKMVGPLLAAMHVPGLAEVWSDFGERLRYHTSLPRRLNELAIIVCARHWVSQVEWWVHARAAVDAGLDASIVDAIAALEQPVFADEEAFEIYEFSRLLLASGQAPALLHEALRNRWGVVGVVELTAVLGYYSMVALTLNAHRLAVPEQHIPLPETGHIACLAEAKLAGSSPTTPGEPC